MKLGKLLAAGKSIMNGREEVSYRASKQIYLPKFGSARNPFKTEAAEPAVQVAPTSAGTDKPVAAPAPGPTRAAVPPVTAVVSANTFAAVTQEAPVVAAISGKKNTNWADKFNPALIFRRSSSKNVARPSDKAKTQKIVTQTELSLDSVKVVHNDLSDVDVEVVPIKSRTGAADLPAPKKSWEYVGEHLFGVEST
jgi:hypothetical protein